MKRALLIYFIFSLLLGTSIYVAQQFSLPLPHFVNNYVNDFLIIPIILTICLFILRWSKNDKNYQIPLSIILYLCVFYSLLFEGYFPTILERYTADIVDVILYFSSGIVFYILQQKTS
jgi:cytochrome bd-type quinol oxidase subunit 2